MQEIDNMIKLLIVDDSTFMRVKIRNLLESEPEIKIVGIARDGRDAVKKHSSLNPMLLLWILICPTYLALKLLK